MNEVVQFEHPRFRDDCPDERPGPQSLWVIATDLREDPDAARRRCEERLGIESPSIPPSLALRMYQHEALRCGQHRGELEGWIAEPAVSIDRQPVTVA